MNFCSTFFKTTGLVFLVFFSLNTISLEAQTVKGVVVSSSDQEPIPFVSIALSNTGVGTVSDLEGKYVINLPSDYIGEIWIRHVGHMSLTLTADQFRQNFSVELESNVEQLEEVVFVAGENPANDIIRQVIRNRKQHDPEQLTSYRFKSYAKEIYKLDPNRALTDSVLSTLEQKEDLTWKEKRQWKTEKNIENSYLFIAESVAEERFIQPGMRNEEVLATKISGFSNGLLAATGSSYQPLGFYDDVIMILGIEYISPIRVGALLQYEFYIENTTIYQEDTVYSISFLPKRGKKFEALKGVLEISTNGYALKKVKAETANIKSKIWVKVEQDYDIIENRWFPIMQYSNFVLQDIDYHGHQIILENYRHISDIEFEPNLSMSEFNDVSLNITNIKESESLDLIESKRPIPLDSLETQTYDRLDSLTSLLKPVEILFNAGFTQRLPIGPLDVRVNNFISFNQHENVRLGLGMGTNSKFSRKVRLGGYVGLGIGDDEWKYGTDLRYEFNKRNSTFLQVKYFNDLKEVGRVDFFEQTATGLSDLIKALQGSLFDRNETYKFTLNSRIAPFMYAQFNTTLTDINPTYDYTYLGYQTPMEKFTVNQMSFSLRYAKNERYIDVYDRKVSTGYDFPAIRLMYTHSNSTWLEGDFDFDRLSLQIEYRKKFFLGKSYFLLNGAYLSGKLPYGLMITGQGNKESLFGVWGLFQVMRRYEFLSDQNVSLFFKHNFGNFLVNTNFIKPELILYQNSGIGDLSNPNIHDGIAYKSMSKGYFESGLALKNLIRLNYFDVAYFTFGVESYYRYGYYSYPAIKNNIAVKLNLSFSI